MSIKGHKQPKRKTAKFSREWPILHFILVASDRVIENNENEEEEVDCKMNRHKFWGGNIAKCFEL